MEKPLNQSIWKRKKTKLSDLEKILKRMELITNKVPGLCELLYYDYQISNAIVEFQWRSNFIKGKTLEAVLQEETNLSSLIIIFKNLQKLELNWKNLGFIHGDLSLKNFIITENYELVAIDWSLDNNKYFSTPAFSSFIDFFYNEKSMQGQHISFLKLRAAVFSKISS